MKKKEKYISERINATKINVLARAMRKALYDSYSYKAPIFLMRLEAKFVLEAFDYQTMLLDTKRMEHRNISEEGIPHDIRKHIRIWNEAGIIYNTRDEINNGSWVEYRWHLDLKKIKKLSLEKIIDNNKNTGDEFSYYDHWSEPEEIIEEHIDENLERIVSIIGPIEYTDISLLEEAQKIIKEKKAKYQKKKGIIYKNKLKVLDGAIQVSSSLIRLLKEYEQDIENSENILYMGQRQMSRLLNIPGTSYRRYLSEIESAIDVLKEDKIMEEASRIVLEVIENNPGKNKAFVYTELGKLGFESVKVKKIIKYLKKKDMIRTNTRQKAITYFPTKYSAIIHA